MDKIIKIALPIIILIVWLMPVSNQLNTLNNSMIQTCYILNLCVLIFVFLYEQKLNIRLVNISFGILVLLLLCSFIYSQINSSIATISYGYLFNYLSFCILINIKIDKLCKSKMLDVLFNIVCWVIVVIGIMSFLQNGFVENLLKTYYVNHYPHVYYVMWEAKKTVTFFATHSIACYIYFILWMLLDYRNGIQRSINNYLLMTGMIFNILMCKSFSAVMCMLLVFLIYYARWIRKASKRTVFFSLAFVIILLLFTTMYSNDIYEILNSNKNGFLGRFGADGNLLYTIGYVISSMIPIGLCDVTGLWLTDGGFFIHFIRGGIVLVALYYSGLYLFIKRNIVNKRTRNVLFCCFLLFEMGYQFTMSIRFFMLMLFFVMEYKYLNCIEERLKNNIPKSN